MFTPISVRALSAIILPMILMLATGCGEEPEENPPVADPAGPWSRGAPLQMERQELPVVELDGKIYAIGGIVSRTRLTNTVEVYDPATDRWSAAAPLPIGTHHSAAVVAGGKIYVMGGWDNLFFARPLNRIFAYDPATDRWTEKARMPTGRGSPAGAAIDGRIYLAGGDPGGNLLTVYDPATDRWSRLADMPTARQHTSAVSHGGKLYVLGGRSELGAGVGNVDAAEVFDPATGEWTRLAPMPTARGGLAAAVAGPYLLTFGGEGNPADPTGTFPEVEAYDTRTGTWQSLSPMPTPRHGIGAATVDGRIYIPGGGPLQGFATSGVTEIYDTSLELTPDAG